MRIETPAIVCALLNHGEHGAVVRLMTPEDGLQAAYVRGARGRRMRPVLIPGNLVQARLSSRTDTQLAHAELELAHSRGPLLGEPLPAAAIEWATALDGLLAAIEAAPAASAWGAGLVRFELLLLAELGFGLDLESCAVTGTKEDLVAVSPKSGRSISAAEAAPFAGKLLALPAFLLRSGPASWADIIEGLLLTGHFLTRDVLTDRSASLLLGRERLVDRLRRAAGLA
jgi:DNA repair protein RecO (recombination protein O)